ncbi:MAG: MG2 domain-containing protein, partial [Acidobacteriota bacterium]|nr:MG2 domain-containing protein [Acidobacteriota bacterium]
MKGKFSLAVAVCLFLVGAVQAQNLTSIVETETQVILQENAAQISFVAESSQNDFDGVILLELLDVKGVVRSTMASRERIKRGRETYKISLPLFDLMRTNSDDIAWFRLRYRIKSGDGNLQTEGVISLSEIIKDIFELRVTSSEYVFSGMNYRARICAFQPFTNEPVKNVRIRGELQLSPKNGQDKLKFNADRETDDEGFAVLNFKIPLNVNLDDDDDGELKITGVKYGIVREIEEDLNMMTGDSAVYLNTDKPLYQPGQTLNVRGILLKGMLSANMVVAGAELEFIIKDEEDTILYRQTVKTSGFGIAAISWQIPENARLGTYQIKVESDGEHLAYENFKVSRYDLPNFAVSVKPDRSFYLPSDVVAGVEVRADYLFGKPVTNGKVKVVQETKREWDYREQKWKIEEAKTFEGETDADGKFTARINLTEAHIELADREYRRYEDLNFAAYFTDPTTNRTEQRRFDLRLTKEAIHVYLIGDTYNRHPNLPIVYYVSTFYADGSPAVCDVTVKGNYESESEVKEIVRLKTNRYGAGKLEFAAPKNDAYEKDLELKITAVDDRKQSGTFKEEIDFDPDDDELLIRMEKT